MRILNEKHLHHVWTWNDREREELTTRFQTNIELLLAAIFARLKDNDKPSAKDLKDLAVELQQAGEQLQQSMENCFEAAQTLYVLAAPTPEEQEKRKHALQQLAGHIGQPVVLRQTSVAELKGKQLLLEQIRGIKGVLRDGDQYWDALLDYLVPILRYEPGEKRTD